MLKSDTTSRHSYPVICAICSQHASAATVTSRPAPHFLRVTGNYGSRESCVRSGRAQLVPGSERDADVVATSSFLNMALQGGGGLGSGGSRLIVFGLLLVALPVSWARFHQLKLKDDIRQKVLLNTFGFFKDGYMSVTINSFSLKDNKDFSGSDSSTDQELHSCILKNPPTDVSIMLLKMDFVGKRVYVSSAKHDMPLVSISEKTEEPPKNITKADQPEPLPEKMSRRDTEVAENANKKKEDALEKKDKEGTAESATKLEKDANQKKAVEKKEKEQKGPIEYNATMHVEKGVASFQFSFNISSEELEGLYSLYFHSCAGNGISVKQHAFSLDIKIIEKNTESYLSADEIPLPKLYISMALFFFVAGLVWVHILRKRRCRFSVLFGSHNNTAYFPNPGKTE
ncbi:hypothetical protein XELAEV_18041652mg [Xenopus laevis]|uniref:Uncharacterized protein n=1 Tax=Xenopus laevis TaxID=8355 RepID=A0A974C2R7_XENLA|nr:hypothetical protein XELAEV_18041652mg [Xenopus laevis]